MLHANDLWVVIIKFYTIIYIISILYLFVTNVALIDGIIRKRLKNSYRFCTFFWLFLIQIMEENFFKNMSCILKVNVYHFIIQAVRFRTCIKALIKSYNCCSDKPISFTFERNMANIPRLISREFIVLILSKICRQFLQIKII